MTDSQSTRRIRTTTLITHAIVIVIICVLPEMLMKMSHPARSAAESWWLYTKSWTMIAVFYVNYFLIIDRTLVVNRKRWHFIWWNLLLIFIASAVMFTLNSYGIGHSGHLHKGPPNLPPMTTSQAIITKLSFIFRDSLMLLLAVSLAVVLRLSHIWRDMEQKQQELLAINRESELENLRTQLNPHFLFNSLNNIYALIEIAPAEAQQSVHKLSNLLRYVVYENPERVKLAQEVEFVNDYIDLMRLRMANRPINLKVDISAPPSTSVPPLLFVSLLENAFKHGNTPDSSKPISINIFANAERVEFTTENPGDHHTKLDSKHGVGLANLQRRIVLIYGKNASLQTKLSDDNIFHAKLRINLCEN